MAAPTDPELVRRCLDGDEAAWELLIDRYGALILSIPRRYGLRAAQADDVFADVCLALVRSLARLRDPQTLAKWLIMTTTRATWEAARKAKVAPPDDLPPLTGAAPPDEVVEGLEKEQLVRDALAEVPDRCRRLLELLYFTVPEPSYDEIAKEMDMPRGSLGPTRRRCLDKMRSHLEPALGGDVSGKRGAPS
jgi:RNA polymerase sigma factor (sigma-70 family)